jgi:hypothetical protein
MLIASKSDHHHHIINAPKCCVTFILIAFHPPFNLSYVGVAYKLTHPNIEEAI